MQVIKDKCAVLDGYKVGEMVNVSLNLKGRLWTNPQGEEKCFNTLECWKISKEANNAPEPQPLGVESEDSGLPF